MGERKVFADSVTPLPGEPGLTAHGLMVQAAEPENLNEQMRVLFSLEIPPKDEAELEARVARGEVVPLDELQQKYAADPVDRKKLVAWLKRQHFDVTEVSPDGTSVYARASADQIGKSLGVDMVRVTKEGVTYTAAKNAPSLPADVGKSVHAIIGLQPFRQARKHFRVGPHTGNRASLSAAAGRAAKRGSRTTRDGGTKRGSGTARVKAATVAVEPTPNIANTPPYLVSEILKAYGADGLALTGKGQTIAILIDTFPDPQDLEKFWAINGLPMSLSRIEAVNVNDIFLPRPTGEESMDAQWSSGIAPGANVRIYATGSLGFADIDRGLDSILADLPSHPEMHQLSISMGLGEIFQVGPDGLPDGYVRTQHTKFLKLAAAGVNVFVSSGDAGSNPDNTGHSATGPTQVEYESSDPNVIGVGGTTLKLSPDGAVASEVGWAGSGGGESIFFARPTWQTGAGVPAGTQRLVPDVSLVGDGSTGVLVILNGAPFPVPVAGTSLSAPVWAGFCALINEACAKANKPFLPFLNPKIYPLLGTACFRDITAGSNGAFTAGPGYDLVTGIGVPNVAELIKALA
jgi:kumamolisin